MQRVKLEIIGKSALIMHADTLADPLHPRTKEFKKVSGKRTKTDEDHEKMAWLEFQAGLYRDESGDIVMPYPNIMKCLIEGARMSKSGPKVERGVTIAATTFPLQYTGPRDPEGLYADKKFVSRMTVKVGTSRTIRCRPKFPEWAIGVEAFLDPTILAHDEFADIAANAGNFIGLGDYRKGGGFGRFQADVTLL